jgi:predicted DsbA family dithiol-disulfide isomerase
LLRCGSGILTSYSLDAASKREGKCSGPARNFRNELTLVMRTNPLRIDIYSDLICPWCYIGRHRLQAALDTLDETVKPEIRWLPFQLNPDMPKTGLDRRAYRSAKFGNWERSQEMDRHVVETGKSLGLEFNYDRVFVTPNTLAGHRLLWWAGERGGQDALADKLFHAYFSQGRDIGNLKLLAEVAGEAGLPVAEARRFLESDSGCEEVLKEETEARRQGLNAVPFFVLNETLTFSGAQLPQVFAAAFRELLASTGPSCDADGRSR